MKRRNFFSLLAAAPIGLSTLDVSTAFASENNNQLTSEIVRKTREEFEDSRLVDKWKKTGLLKGLEKSEETKMARWLEGLCRSIVLDTNYPRALPLSLSVGKFVLPIQRRVRYWQLSLDDGWLLVDGRRFETILNLMSRYSLYDDFPHLRCSYEVELTVCISEDIQTFAKLKKHSLMKSVEK